MDRVSLCALTREEMDIFVRDALHERPYRADQIARWVAKDVSIDRMTNLPAGLRARLGELAVTNPVRIERGIASRLDETEKYLYALEDGNVVEGVLMRYHHGYSLCVSTQVGCRMGCRFCASTLEGCVRNLTAAEILGQVLCANARILEKDPEGRVHNIVLMGSGEPLDNYDEVVRFLRLVNRPDGLNVSLRNVSLSTCGLVPKMRAFTNEGLPVTLSLSLHAPNDEIRRKIMPVANAYPMDDVLEAARDYVSTTGRRLIVEYALISGVNASPACAKELAGRLRRLQCHVNLIPLNAVRERSLRPADAGEVRAFLKALESHHISATVRRTMGSDIEGACGQLRRKVLSERAENEHAPI